MVHNTEKNNKRNQRGLSLIETSMVLALSAIVVPGVMYYYQAASDNNKTQSTVSEVMSIVSAVNGLYVGTSGYNGLNKTVIMNTSAIPENYKDKKGTKITHPFGGEIEIGATAGNTKYYIVLKDVPQGACVNLASMNFGTSLAGAGVGADVESQAQKGTLRPNALTPADAAKVCNQATNNIAFLLK